MIEDYLKRIKNIFSSMKTEKEIVEGVWSQVSSVTTPEVFGEKKVNTLRPRKYIYDLQQALASAVTSPKTKWFHFIHSGAYDKERLNFLEKLDEIFYVTLRRSNFYNIVQNVYEQLIVFGTACVMVEKDDEKDFSLSITHPNDFWIKTNIHNELDFFVRRVEMSVSDAVDFFEKETPQEIREELENSPNKKHIFYQAIFKRNGIIRLKASSKQKPYASIWFRESEENIIRESGYDYMPVVLARWETKYGKPYGYSPCIHSASLIKNINNVEKLLRLRVEREVNKPLAFYGIDQDSIKQVLTGEIQGIAIPPSAEDRPSIVDILNYRDNIEKITGYILYLKQELADNLYNDVLIAFAQQRTMTATEAQLIQNEKLLRLDSFIFSVKISNDFLLYMALYHWQCRI